VRELLAGDQRELDGVLKELGAVARQEKIEAPGTFDDMRRVEAEEQRRRDAEQGQKIASEELVKEEARREAERREQEEDLAERARQAGAIEARLAARQAERRELQSKKNRLEAQAKTGAVGDELGVVVAKVSALSEPIAKLSEELALARGELDGRRRAMRDAAERHEKTLAELAADRARCEKECESADREMSRRFVSIGTMINLNRVEHARLTPIYARIDALKALITEKETTLERLDLDRRSFDQKAVQKGLVVLGGATVAMLLAVVVVILLASR